MKGGEKDATVPPERSESIRRRIVSCLEAERLSARQISGRVGIPERAVPEHLGHVSRSLAREGRRLRVTPASCLDCGFVFRKRERFTRPGKCPLCRGTSIEEPLFSVPAPGEPPAGNAAPGSSQAP